MADVQNLKNEFEDDELKALIAGNMSQTFSSENISVSEDLIAKTLGRIKALPVSEAPVVPADELEAKRRKKSRRRNRIVASLSTVAAALVIGLIGINFIGNTKESLSKSDASAPMKAAVTAESTYGSDEAKTSVLAESAEENVFERNEDMGTGLFGTMTSDFAVDSIFDFSTETAKEEYDFSDAPVIADNAEPAVSEVPFGGFGFASVVIDSADGGIPVYEIAEAEFPEKYQELSYITEEIVNNSAETEENDSDIAMIMTLTANNGNLYVYNFGSRFLCETEYVDDGRIAEVKETHYDVPELDEYMEDIYSILETE